MMPTENLNRFRGSGISLMHWRKNDDHQYLGKLDATWHVTQDGMNTIQAGVVAQKLNRANYEDDYQLNPSIINGSTQPFTSIDSAKVTVFGYGSTQEQRSTAIRIIRQVNSSLHHMCSTHSSLNGCKF